MSETVLVINSGSSSLKYQLIDSQADVAIAGGVVERIGEEESRVEHTNGDATTEHVGPIADHRHGMGQLLAAFDQLGPRLHDAGVVAVGHRVVMGGRAFDGPTLIDDEVIGAIDRLSPLAPLHNPPNLTAIRVGTELLPDIPHVAVFDTAFFHHLPAAAATYAIDREIAAAHGIRRFGFHGTSHQYVAARTAELLERDRSGLRQMVLHLGNGASASAIVGGAAVETSMGMTPLEGLVMGTRSGDIDPAVVLHLARNAAMDVDELDELLNQRSGMLGLTGRNDMREVHDLIAQGDPTARLGLDVYVHRIKKYIGAYAAVMGGLDTLTFTAGVGEHDPVVRAEATAGLEHLGIEVDPGRNERPSDEARLISTDGSAVAVMVVPTDEELAIARQVMSIL